MSKNPTQATARESARETTGEFGEQPRPDQGDTLIPTGTPYQPFFVKPVDCRKCGGTGIYLMLRAPGFCSRCNGRGKVESDKTAIATAKLRVQHIQEFNKAATAHSWYAHCAAASLEETNPIKYLEIVERFAEDSDQMVFEMLDAYYRRETGSTRHPHRQA